MVQKSEIALTHPNWWTQIYGPMRQLGERVAEFLSPSSEAATTRDAYEVNIELPGVSEDDITVEVHGDQLAVTGEKRSAHEEHGKDFYFSERAFGKFRRTFTLPADADAEKISASHKDGVLAVTIPKLASPAARARRISVKQA